MSKIREIYLNNVVPYFLKNGLSNNVMAVPKLIKVVVNSGFKSTGDKNFLNIKNDMSLMCGQMPVFTKAKKSISNFKLREKYTIGCKVTLRKKNMYNFLDKLLFLVIPRIRDFKGFSVKSFDGKGNYSFGLKEHIVFPEIDYDKVDKIIGMNISFVTNALTNDRGKQLLNGLGFPFN